VISEPPVAGVHTAFVALGSNIEPRIAYVESALNEVSAHPGIHIIKISSIYETQPVGGPEGQGPYLNAVMELAVHLSPHELLTALLAIETQLGRKRDIPWGPRTIDLDILLYDRLIIADEDLVIPHPLMHERRFVMQGLAEIAPEVVHPMIGMSAQTILENLGDSE
jgi:2-amino-4-hydroxy-6-hydroxymethyldihydropteridine diphosphokinase